MARNREALLEAAVRCLQQRGYANTSARDLVAESGTNLGAIGYHFGSKQGLLNEAISLNVRCWIDQVGGLLRQQRAAGAGLESVLEQLFVSVRENQPLLAAFIDALAVAAHEDEFRQQLAADYERFRSDVTDVLQSLYDEMGVEDGRTFSSVLIALVDGLLIQWFLDPDGVSSANELTRSLSLVGRLAPPSSGATR